MTISLDETLDDLTVAGLKILQAQQGYRFSIDPVLLSAFIPRIKNAQVVDLGTGIIPLLLSARGSVFAELRGRFYVVLLAERLAELLSGMRCFRLEPKRLRMVHSREGEFPSWCWWKTGRMAGRGWLLNLSQLFMPGKGGTTLKTFWQCVALPKAQLTENCE